MATSYSDQVQKVYIAYYGRAADPVGLAYWAAKVETDGLAGIMASFGASAEATTLYGSLTNTAKVNALYQQSFGRDADFAGLMYYAGQLTAGTMTAATIAQNIFDGASGADATILANKLIVAKAYTTAIDTASEVVAYSGTVAAASARALLTTVDAATVTTGFDVATSVAGIVTASSAAATAAATAGTTIALTKTTDTLTGGTGADTINGVIAAMGGDGTTAAAGDTINGGDGIDKMIISATGATTAAYSAAAITTSGVEKVLISNFDTGATDTWDHTVDASLMTGLTTVGLSASAALGDTHFTNLKNIVDVEMSNGSGDFSVAYQAAAVVGTADTQKLTLSNQTAGSFLAASMETVAITSSTLANTLTTLTADSATKITMSGAAKLTITNELSATVANIATIDASGMTAAVSLVNDNTTTNATLGSANDTYKTGAAVAVGYSVDGGAGTADTLSVTAATVMDTALEAARYTNFEVLQINNLSDATQVSSQDMSLLNAAINTVTIVATDDGADGTDAAATMTTGLTKAPAEMTVNLSGFGNNNTTTTNDVDILASVAAASDSAADIVHVVMGTATAASGATASASNTSDVELSFTASDAETLTIKSQGGANTIAILDAADLVTLTLTGNKALTIETINNNTAMTSLDASGMTAALIVSANASTTAGTYTLTGKADTLTGSTKADTITGGAGIDTITGGAGGDTVHGGDGDDVIIGGLGADTLKGDAGDDNFKHATLNLGYLDTIDGGTGKNKITLTNAATVVDADFTNVTNVQTLAFDGAVTALTLGTLATSSGIVKVTTAADGVANSASTLAVGYTSDVAFTLNANSDDITATAYTGALSVTADIDDITTADDIIGGTGSDTLVVTLDGTTDTALASGDVDGIINFETIQIGTNASAGITLGDTNIASGKSMTIDGTKITGSGNVLTVVATNETDGNLTVLGGSGGDAITGSASALGDTLKGNKGDDTFNFATANFTTLDTVDGGAGTGDKINISDAATVVDADFTNVTNVEKLTGASTLTVTIGDVAQAAALSNISSVGALSLTIDKEYTSALTLALVATNDTVTGTAYTGDMTVTYAADNLDVNDTLTGGTAANDSIKVSGAGAVALAGTDLTNVSAFEKIIIGTDAGVASVTLFDANVASAKSLTVDGTALTSGTYALTFVGTAETNGAVTVLGGAGADMITSTASSVGDTLKGGAGIDTFTFATTSLSSVDTVQGDGGVDILTFSNAGTISDADFTNITTTETVTAVADTGTTVITVGALAAAAGITLLNGTDNVNTFTLGAGFTNKATVALTDGVDTIVATEYTKALTVTIADDDLLSTDTITGGTGADTLTITFGGTALAAADMAGVSKIETIKTASNVTGGLTMADANIAKGSSMTINTSKNTSVAFTFDASAELDGTINYVGGAGADTVTGGAKNDTINGGVGIDTITGGKGVDTLTGGTLADKFVYTNADQSNSSGADTITDFVTGTDKIVVTLDLSARSNAQTVDATVNVAAAGTSAVQSGLSGSVGQATYDKTNSQLIINGNADNLVTTLDYVINVGPVATAANSIVEGDINYVITGGTGADSITAGGGADNITGGDGADTITAGAGADIATTGAGGGTVIMGDGADKLTGGGGTDIVKYVATTAALLATESGTTAGTDNDFASGTVGDQVTTWVSATDKIHFPAALLTNAIGTEVDTLVTVAATGTVTNAARFVEMTASSDGTMGAFITAANALTTSAVAIGDSFLAWAHDNTDGYLYLIEQVSVADTIAAQDVTLVGSFIGVTNPANGDFVSF